MSRVAKNPKDPRTGQLAFGYRGDPKPKRCNQCWKLKSTDEFINPKTNRITQDCNECRIKRKAPVEDHRTGLRTEGEHRVTWIQRGRTFVDVLEVPTWVAPHQVWTRLEDLSDRAKVVAVASVNFKRLTPKLSFRVYAIKENQ